MEIEWLIEGKCPQKKDSSLDEATRVCTECPYAIWEYPAVAAALNSAMCSVVLGDDHAARELDSLVKRLMSIENFARGECAPSMKRGVLKQIADYARETGWSLEERSSEETMEHLEMLIEFCSRAEEKSLRICAVA